MTELAQQLAAGGLELLGLVDRLTPLIPPTLATVAMSYPRESEPRPYSTVEIGAEDLVAQANAGWFRLASEGGLFDASREFLVGVAPSGEWWWAHVRLAQSWDVMGLGSASILGNGEGYPGFIMMSLDGDVIVHGDVWQSEIGSVLTRNPAENQQLREHARWKVESPLTPDYEKTAIHRWLEASGKDTRSQ
jgi:hypothetical protein